MTNEQVVAKWLHGSSNLSNNNLSIKEDVLYSYNTPLAIYKYSNIFISDYCANYSITSKKHASIIKKLSRYDYYVIPMISDDIDKVLKAYDTKINELDALLNKKRKGTNIYRYTENDYNFWLRSCNKYKECLHYDK